VGARGGGWFFMHLGIRPEKAKMKHSGRRPESTSETPLFPDAEQKQKGRKMLTRKPG